MKESTQPGETMLLYAVVLAALALISYFAVRKMKAKAVHPLQIIPGLFAIASLGYLIAIGNVLFIISYAFFIPAGLYLVSGFLHAMNPKAHPLNDASGTTAGAFLTAILFALPCLGFFYWGMHHEMTPHTSSTAYMDGQPVLEIKNDRAWISLK